MLLELVSVGVIFLFLLEARSSRPLASAWRSAVSCKLGVSIVLVFSVAHLSGHKSAVHTNIIYRYELEVKQYATLHSKC